MSNESAESFLDAIHNDKDFHEKVAQAASREARTQLIKDAGYSFTDKELSSVRGIDAKNEELTDAELDSVSGGVWGGESCCCSLHI